jgi:hypothetical protein
METTETAQADGRDHTPDEREEVVLDLHGRDLIVVPPAALWSLDDAGLYAALFGPSEAGAARAMLVRPPRACAACSPD